MYNTIIVDHQNVGYHMPLLAQTKSELLASFERHVTIPNLAMDMLFRESTPKGDTIGVLRIIKRGNAPLKSDDVTEQYYKGQVLEEHTPAMFIPENKYLGEVASHIVDTMFVEGDSIKLYVHDLGVKRTNKNLDKPEAIQLLTELLMVYSMKHKREHGYCPLHALTHASHVTKHIDFSMLDDGTKSLKFKLDNAVLYLSVNHYPM